MIVTAGVARFSYTSLLPIMQSQAGLSEIGGGWLAAVNYFGYLTGVLLVANLNNLNHKYNLYRWYLVLAVLTTAAMALTTNVVVWAVLRYVSGICTSAGFIIASGLILKWLVNHNKRAELGIHFSGIGISIFLAAVLVEGLMQLSVSWYNQWLYLALMGGLFAIPAWCWMPHPAIKAIEGADKTPVDKPPTRLFTYVLIVAYCCAGYGYVVSATFIVDIVEGLPTLKGHGQHVFIVLGLAATPAVLIWDRIARKLGYLKSLLLAYIVQIISIALPATTENLITIGISAMLFGGSFVACVSLVLTMAGHFFPSNPAKFMGKMTVAYGGAQMVAPALTGQLVAWSGNYNLGLYLSASIMLLGAVLVGALIWLDRPSLLSRKTAELDDIG